jgi:hypothetical protein
MYKTCLQIALFGVAMLPLANAQSTEAIEAHVPFRFTVAKAMLAAGDYRLWYDSADHLLSIHSLDQNAKSQAYAFTYTRFLDGNESHRGGAQVLFRCYGQSCFLYQVWQGDEVALEVPETRSEHKMAANRTGKIVARIAICRK